MGRSPPDPPDPPRTKEKKERKINRNVYVSLRNGCLISKPKALFRLQHVSLAEHASSRTFQNEKRELLNVVKPRAVRMSRVSRDFNQTENYSAVLVENLIRGFVETSRR